MRAWLRRLVSVKLTSVVALGFAFMFLSASYSHGVAANARMTASRPTALTGFIVFSRGKLGSLGLWSMRPDGSALHHLPLKVPNAEMPAVSPNGRQLLYASGNPVLDFSAPPREFLLLTDSGGIRKPSQFTVFPGTAPSWSPDGKRVVFVGDVYGITSPLRWTEELVVTQQDGGQARAITREPSTPFGSPSWTRDGRIVYSDGVSIYSIRSDGGSPKRLGQGYGPSVSPDGKWITFVRYRRCGSCTQQLYVMRLDGTGVKDLHVVGIQPRWAPDGRHLVCLCGAPDNLGIVDLDQPGHVRSLPLYGYDAVWFNPPTTRPSATTNPSSRPDAKLAAEATRACTAGNLAAAAHTLVRARHLHGNYFLARMVCGSLLAVGAWGDGGSGPLGWLAFQFEGNRWRGVLMGSDDPGYTGTVPFKQFTPLFQRLYKTPNLKKLISF